MQKDYCYLDKIRIDHGIDKCKAVFLEVYKKDRWRAIALLNDPNLTFPCLFILLRKIEAYQLESSLSFRNITVLKIIDQIQKKQKYQNGKDYLSVNKGVVYPIFRWILETGYTEDGLDNEYDEIMDVTVSVLINSYKDKSILPVVVDMIFKRNKKEHYIHDMVWALLQSHTPDALKLIAERICSSDQQDIDLACHLLNFGTSNSSYNTEDREKQYQTYIQWLNENDPFLYFTGESFQFSSNPTLCKVDLERKYLNNGSTSYSEQPVVPKDENEKKCLKAFKMLSDEEKTILSEYSYIIHHENSAEWKRWMSTSLSDQIKIAKARWEGVK